MSMFGLPMRVFGRQYGSKEAPASPIYPIYNNTEVEGHLLYSAATEDHGKMLYHCWSNHPNNAYNMRRHGIDV